MGDFSQSSKSSRVGLFQVKEWIREQVEYRSKSWQRLFGDCFDESSLSKYGSRDQFNITTSGLEQLRSLWAQIKSQGLADTFTRKYGGIAGLLSVEVDGAFLRAALELWDPSYRCFSSKEWDLTPTLEEYSSLLDLPFIELPPKLFMWTPRKPEWYLCQLFNIRPDFVKGCISRNGKQRCVSKDLFIPFVRRTHQRGARVESLCIANLWIGDIPNNSRFN